LIEVPGLRGRQEHAVHKHCEMTFELEKEEMV